ncbi:MAG: spore photoproduct lyase family protein, partial [Acidobacteriota bacterium]
MVTIKSYERKLVASRSQTWFQRLDSRHREFIHQCARKYLFTFQELRLVCEAALDLQMWHEESLIAWWDGEEAALQHVGRASKIQLLQGLQAWLQSLKSMAKPYPKEGLPKPEPYSLQVVAQHSDKTVLGTCPVASEETVCCNLRTIDAVENCGLGCSYCAIQTFYGDKVVFDADLRGKLKNLELSPDRFYHLGTGQSSDSLMWGNQHGVLDVLSEFASEHPNILLELKTKSRNIDYFLKHRGPSNIVLSWSLNTPTIIRNEEHFTAQLTERLTAARRVADEGIKVAFHFHPLVYYRGWRDDYRDVVDRVLVQFTSDEVLFVSFGSVTFTKPIIKAIRESRRASKMLQMELVPVPKGKLSYPDKIKKEMFGDIYAAFAPWHGKVFMYLCMEKAELWK